MEISRGGLRFDPEFVRVGRPPAHDACAGVCIGGLFTIDGKSVPEGFARRADGSYFRFFESIVEGMNNVGQVVGTRNGRGFIARFREETRNEAVRDQVPASRSIEAKAKVSVAKRTFRA